MSSDPIDPFPWFLNKPLNLLVNDRAIETRIRGSEWVAQWRPLLERLLKLWLAVQPRRFLVAVVGPPGAGKTVLAEQLHWITNSGLLHKEMRSAALPMDGFHYAADYLESHTRKLPDGDEIRLSSVKGQPDTIDVEGFRRQLKLLVASSDPVTWPGYSRATHDVIPDQYFVSQGVNLVFIEGNYLLLNIERFVGIPALFDLRIYLDAPGPKIMANLMQRHIAGGKTFEEAKYWVKHIDLPNARIVESTRASADVIIHRNHDDDLSAVIWRQDLAPNKPPTPPSAS